MNDINNMEGNMNLVEDTTERNLGLKKHRCRICGEEGEFQSYLVCELMQNTREEFEYFVCSKCNCLQISDVPVDLGKYYENNYYSFSKPVIDESLLHLEHNDMTKILDVGSGNGHWLIKCAMNGYGNLYGCDPFIEKDICYGNCVNIRKCTIHDMEGDNTFDHIRFGDSYEHMSDPVEVLTSAKRLLKDDGVIEVIIPTYPNIAFDMFGPYWYQIDAPRHIFLYSVSCIEYIVKKCGLNIKKIEYDSDAGQIIFSYFYQHKIPYTSITKELIEEYFSLEEIVEIDEMTKEVNMKQYGDHMRVYIQK